ncbi:MAG: hypothetical protein Kow00108_20100 [Calditrichia bacterium]
MLLIAPIAGAIGGHIIISILYTWLVIRFSKKIRSLPEIRERSRFYLIRSAAILMTAIAKADGVYKKVELAYIKSFMRHYFQMYSDEFSWYLKDLKKFAFQKRLPILHAIHLMNQYGHKHEKKFFIHCACELANIDNHIHSDEKKVIDYIGRALKISEKEMKTIWEKYRTSTDKYFKILGVKPDTPLHIIRKRYLELAKYFHPDRFRHRSLEEQNFAVKKMQVINEAWNEILKAKQSVN